MVTYRELRLGSSLLQELNKNWFHRGGRREITDLLSAAEDYPQLFALESDLDDDGFEVSVLRGYFELYESEILNRDVSDLEVRYAVFRDPASRASLDADYLERLVDLHTEMINYSGSLLGIAASAGVSDQSRQLAAEKLESFGRPREHFRAAFHNTAGAAVRLIGTEELDSRRFSAAVERVHFFAEMYLIWCERKLRTFDDRRAIYNLVRALKSVGNPAHAVLVDLL